MCVCVISIGLACSIVQFDEGRVDFTGELTSTDIQTFASANQLPYVIEFSDAVAPKIFGGAVKTHVLLFAPKVYCCVRMVL